MVCRDRSLLAGQDTQCQVCACYTNIQETQKSNKKLIGNTHDTNNMIKPGVEVIRKLVVHIDNLNVNCTSELLKRLFTVS